MSEKCSPDDQNRCQGVTGDGQCQYLAGEGGKFCNYHSKGGVSRNKQKRDVERYLIQDEELRKAYNRQKDDKGYLSLKEEIYLIHVLLEKRMNMIKDDATCMMAVGPVTQLVQRLESMKISLMKIQQQLGLVLGKDELRQLAHTIADILSEELDGIDDKEKRMENICERLFTAIEGAGQQSESD